MYSIFRSLLSGFITKTIGLHFRYFFFKLIGRKKRLIICQEKLKMDRIMFYKSFLIFVLVP